MKKIFGCFSVFILLLSIFACDLEKTLSGPRDTWCRRTINVQGTDLNCYLLYSETGYSNTQLNSERFPEKKIEPGLTVVLNPLGDGFIGELTSSTYVVKHFPLGENKAKPIEGENKEPITFTVDNILWNGLWVLNSDTFNKNGLDANPPLLLRTDGKLSFLENVAELSWKDVVIAILEGI